MDDESSDEAAMQLVKEQLVKDLQAVDQGKLAFETLNNLLTVLARRGVIDELDIDEMFGSIIDVADEMNDRSTARVLTAQRNRLLAIAVPEETTDDGGATDP